MKQLLSIMVLATAFVFVACDKDDGGEEGPLTDATGAWSGTLKVVQDDGSDYMLEGVAVQVASIDSKYCQIVMEQVQFSPKMPVKIDMTIDSVPYVKNGSDIEFGGDNIVPKAMGGPFPKYNITEFKGVMNEKISFSMMCGSYPLSYNGVHAE